MRLKIRGRLGVVAWDLARGLRNWKSVAWLGVWAIGGTLVGAAAAVAAGSGTGSLIGLCAGVVAGVGTWFVAVSIRALGAPVDATETVSPAELLRTDRTTALNEGLTFSVRAATVLWPTIWLLFEPAFGTPFWLVFGHGVWFLSWLATVASAAVIWMLSVTVWGPWLIARFWLPLTGRLPWSVMAFLADAHRRGVLRQAGGVYQFRHARLQDHLAAAR